MNVQKFIPLVARAFLVAIFFQSGIGKVLNFAGTQEQIASKGLPLAGVLALGAIIFELLGALSVLLGYKARWGALLLLIFLIPTTLIFHTDFSQPGQMIQFLKNLAIIGGLLLVTYFGSGPLSLGSEATSPPKP